MNECNTCRILYPFFDITVQGAVGAPLVGAPGDDDTDHGAGTRPAPTTAGSVPSISASLGDIVGAFKSITTRQYIDGVDYRGWIPFPKRLWQRNYWERVIRNKKEGDRIRRYIEENPARWFWDRYHVD